jgi:uncharacterized protein
LFGMGFAVMLGRAEHAGRDFVVPYLRRIAGLALFGIAHFILLWTGDILFSYAVGATALMVLFYAPPLPILIVVAVSLMLGLALDVDALSGLAICLSVVGMAGIFLRGDTDIAKGKLEFSVVTPLLIAVGAGLIAVGASQHMLMPQFLGGIAIVGAWLAARFREPIASRTWRLGSFLYLAPFLALALSGLFAIAQPQLRPSLTAEQLADARKEQRELAEDVRAETAVMTGNSYAAAVRYRARNFAKDASSNFGFGVIVLGMFLIGTWFVQSGVMADTAGHLPLFRRMVWYGLPVGLGLSLISSAISVSNHPDAIVDWSYQAAVGLQMIGNLPACLGYVGVIVLLLHSQGVGRRIAVLAPAGRMALTNYLTQTLLQSLFFHGYFLGHWGLPRAQQVIFVLIVYAAQVVFSHWWLSKFRYGPMEWLWRAITYWQWPPMRRTATV